MNRYQILLSTLVLSNSLVEATELFKYFEGNMYKIKPMQKVIEIFQSKKGSCAICALPNNQSKNNSRDTLSSILYEQETIYAAEKSQEVVPRLGDGSSEDNKPESILTKDPPSLVIFLNLEASRVAIDDRELTPRITTVTFSSEVKYNDGTKSKLKGDLEDDDTLDISDEEVERGAEIYD